MPRLATRTEWPERVQRQLMANRPVSLLGHAVTMVIPEPIADWCERWLGSTPTTVLFASDKISAVIGLRLADGREVVVKSRQPRERLAGCVAVQRHLWSAGFPCPEPLAGPAPLGDLVATAERYVVGGTPLVRDADAPRRYADLLARQVALAAAIAERVPTLEPPPYWARWDHELAATWPPDPNVDLNVPAGPDELDAVGERARRRLTRPHGLPDVIGHCDWESQNLGWRDGELLVAHDWDSLARRPEAAIAGMTALIFPSTGTTNEPATLEESESFLQAYERARGRAFTADEREIAWAASAWIGGWKAKKAAVYGDAGVVRTRFLPSATERLRRAGA